MVPGIISSFLFMITAVLNHGYGAGNVFLLYGLLGTNIAFMGMWRFRVSLVLGVIAAILFIKSLKSTVPYLRLRQKQLGVTIGMIRFYELGVSIRSFAALAVVLLDSLCPMIYKAFLNAGLDSQFVYQTLGTSLRFTAIVVFLVLLIGDGLVIGGYSYMVIKHVIPFPRIALLASPLFTSILMIPMRFSHFTTIRDFMYTMYPIGYLLIFIIFMVSISKNTRKFLK